MMWEMIERVDSYVVHNYAVSGPFVWIAMPLSILRKIGRLCNVLYG